LEAAECPLHFARGGRHRPFRVLHIGDVLSHADGGNVRTIASLVAGIQHGSCIFSGET
jgi:hypothetical protein